MEKGLPVHGSGRDPKCKICRALKEDRYMDGSYCAACKLARLKIAYDKNLVDEGKEPRRVGRNPTCKCGKVKEDSSEAQCSTCTNERKRNRRLTRKTEDPDFLAKEREKINKTLKEDELYALKVRTRQATYSCIRAGLLVKQPCEVCGTEEAIQAHHDDYDDHMNVRWLCTKHHAEHHKNEKKG